MLVKNPIWQLIFGYKKSNFDLIKAGHIAGKAIEIAPTNLLHSLSYPLTGYYNISHGIALGYFLPKISKLLSLAYCSSHISVTAAPSVKGDEVAAVTVPF